MEAPQEQQTAEGSDAELRKFLAPKLAWMTIFGFLAFLFFYGGCVTGLVFKEPDICFLLGGGRWILEHGHLPATDPFSYTTHYHWAQYVIEKWLTEVIFYFIYAKTSAVGLLVFDAIMLCLAFVVMPYRILYLSGWRGAAAMGWAFLAALTSFSHLAVRPEVFSFLLAGIWIEVLIRITAAADGNTRIHWKYIALIAVLMCLWSNLHTLFMFGVILPAVYSGCLVIERFIPGVKEKPLNMTVPILTFVCIAVSLINPYGFGLWGYLPNVFGPFNDSNNEMQPIKLSNAGNPAFFPFYLISLLSLIALVRNIRAPLRYGDLFFRLLIPMGIAGGMKTIRSIPLADILVLGGRAKLHRKAEEGSEVESEPSVFDQMTNPLEWKWPSLCVLTTAIGAVLMTRAVPPEIPQPSAAFTPPFKAIEFIEHHPPHGNLLNDPHFGAVMIFKMHDNPPVYIDPRYNLFGNDLLQDYWKMVDCKPSWRELLRKYNIGWIFLPPRLELTRQLAKDPQWQLLYSDNASVIIEKKGADTRQDGK